jgi:hypothetical protein
MFALSWDVAVPDFFNSVTEILNGRAFEYHFFTGSRLDAYAFAGIF